MGFPPYTYTSVRTQAGPRSNMPWYYWTQKYAPAQYTPQYHTPQFLTPAPAIPEIVLTTPEGEHIHGDDIPRGRDICGYTPDYHRQQIGFYETCERNLLPVKPHQQRSMVRNAVRERELQEMDEVERQYERAMELIQNDEEWLRMNPEYSYNQKYHLRSDDDTEKQDTSSGRASSAPVESQTITQNKRPRSLTASWSDIASENKRHKTADKKASLREERQERERRRANLTDKAQSARRLSAELKAKMEQLGLARDEMDNLHRQDEMVRRKLRKYGEEILSLYDEDLSDDNEEDDDDDDDEDDWEDTMVFEMDQDEESDWEIL